ncbi:TNF receptor-associated factor family protein [Gossypium arboreum]|nr:TNF receptor-associated factor family protein [Gossypium arboreum]
MVEYLTQRTETYVAESVVLEGGPQAEAYDNPYDIIAFLIDEFAVSKRNLFSRVSALLLSERREDRIDDFAQQMEINGFWPVDKREAIVQTLLKNVDVKNEYHCSMKFETAEELSLHMPTCSFRVMTCDNEGCDDRFSANKSEKHDSTCPFKIIPCEQKCPDFIMRRDMDRHCITVCPMKLVNCPFFSVGCKAAVPHCKIDEHQSEELHYHILYILQGFHKGASEEVLKERVDQIEEMSAGRLAGAKNVRSLTSKVKDLDARLPPVVIETKKNEEETSETEAKPESVEASGTNEDAEKAAGTKEATNSEAAPASEATSSSKDSKEAKNTETENSEAKPPSQESPPLKKESEEASKNEVEAPEANPASQEVPPSKKDSEEACKTEIKDSEAKPPSQEVEPVKKDSEQALKTVVKDSETMAQSSEDSTTNKDTEEAATTENSVKDSEISANED